MNDQDLIDRVRRLSDKQAVKLERFLECIDTPVEATPALDAVHDSTRFNRGAAQFANFKLARGKGEACDDGEDDTEWLAAFAEGIDRMLASAMLANS